MSDLNEATLDQAEQIFSTLPQREQIFALYQMLRYIRGELAVIKKEQIELRLELQPKSQEHTTSEKIRAIMNERFDTWAWFRDKVLPHIITLMLISILYLTFGKP